MTTRFVVSMLLQAFLLLLLFFNKYEMLSLMAAQ